MNDRPHHQHDHLAREHEDAREHERAIVAMLAAMQRLEPHEIVSACEYVGENNQQDNENLWHERYTFDAALERLPQADPEHARAVYIALAAHPSWEVRLRAAVNVPRLARVDRSYGLLLWDRLVRDRSSDVSFAVSMYLDISTSPSDNNDLAAKCAELGVTPNDLRWLQTSRTEWERGVNIYDPGEASFLHLIRVSGALGPDE